MICTYTPKSQLLDNCWCTSVCKNITKMLQNTSDYSMICYFFRVTCRTFSIIAHNYCDPSIITLVVTLTLSAFILFYAEAMLSSWHYLHLRYKLLLLSVMYLPKKMLCLIKRKLGVWLLQKGLNDLQWSTMILNNREWRCIAEQKYLCIFISSNSSDDWDVKRQIQLTYRRSNTFISKLRKCSDDVKVQLFKYFCSTYNVAHCSLIYANCIYYWLFRNLTKPCLLQTFKFLTKVLHKGLHFLKKFVKKEVTNLHTSVYTGIRVHF